MDKNTSYLKDKSTISTPKGKFAYFFLSKHSKYQNITECNIKNHLQNVLSKWHWRRPSQLRVLPLLANYRLPKGRTFIPKIKNYKKRDRQTNKVQQSQKRKKNLFILTLSYLFLTFSSISSALSISLFSSFGRTILRIIANTAAGTIPEPPKIRLIACGRCTRIAVLEPSP